MKKIVFGLVLLVIIAGVWLALARSRARHSETSEPTYIYVLMKAKNDRPWLDYDGEGLKNVTIEGRGPTESNIFDCDLLAFKIPEGESYFFGGTNAKPVNYVVHFTGTIERTGTNGIHVKGVIVSKISGKIQFVKMTETDKKETDDFPEYPFEPGKTAIDFKGSITGWLEK
jgi:hypothetical protein